MTVAGGALLQISDTHFGTEQPQAVDALLRLAARLRPAIVVLSGDVTQRATASQFAAARSFVDRLAPSPVLVVPGNHDIPLVAWWHRLWRPYGRFSVDFGEPADVVETVAGAWHVVALNTTRAWRHKHGEVSERQAADAAARLRAASPDAVRVVVTHQPPTVANPRERVNVLRGAGAAVQRWHDAGADLVLSGHIHLPAVLPLRGAPRPLWSLQAGTAVSTRVRQQTLNSVTEVVSTRDAAGAHCCVARFWDWAPGDADYHPRDGITLALGPRAPGAPITASHASQTSAG